MNNITEKIDFLKDELSIAKQVKESYENRIKTIEKELSDLEKAKPEFEIWEPEIDEEYFYYKPSLDKIYKDKFAGALSAQCEQKFRTKKQAEIFRKRVMVYEILQKVAIELNGDWESEESYIYVITVNQEIKQYAYPRYNEMMGDIYFESEEKAKFALDYLKKELAKRGIDL